MRLGPLTISFGRGKNGASAPSLVPPDVADAGLAGMAWEDTLTRAMPPQEAESILAGAMCGDLSQQRHLLHSMMDTWAMFSTCDRTVGDAVTGAPFEVLPHADDESEVAETAKEKRDLVWAAFTGMKPKPGGRELDRDGLLKALARGDLAGHEVLEVLWERRLWRGRMAILPRAVRRTGASYYGYPPTGAAELRYRDKRGGTLGAFPEHKFLIHVTPSHGGHPSQGGRFRALTKYWAGATYGWEWLLTYTNKFGTPYMWATYKKESSQLKVPLLNMLGNMGISGRGAFPEGTVLQMLEAGKGAGELPQPLLMKLADQACELVMLGEVQSSGRDGKTGLSSGAVQGAVRRDSLQGYCNNAVTTLQQLARMVCLLNYGTADECPCFACEIPEPEDAKVNAETDEILTRMGMPVTLAELQRRHDKAAPADGDVVLMGNTLVKWSEALVKDGSQKEAKEAKEPNKQEVTAAKAEGKTTLEEVMERLLINAVLDGVADFEQEATEATEREEKEERETLTTKETL